MHPVALVQHCLSVCFAWFCLKWVKSRVAAVTVRQLYIALRQKTCIALRTVRDFHRTSELSYCLLSPAAYPMLSLFFCCLILQGADLAH